ncbi:hypothetical protein D918_03587 [Trichuris suis]|nr:hypothetical protein D918_03587 [Trichuris suis]
MCPPNAPFIALSYLTRMLKGVGAAAYMTSAISIVAFQFPKKAATVIGVLEVFNGMGYTVGPTLGGLLYKYGGYITPFALFGTILVIFCFISSFLKALSTNVVQKASESDWKLLLKPDFFFALFSVFMGLATVTFPEPTMASHVEDLHLAPEAIGLIFTISALTYAVTCPAVGAIIDRQVGEHPGFQRCVGYISARLANNFTHNERRLRSLWFADPTSGSKSIYTA